MSVALVSSKDSELLKFVLAELQDASAKSTFTFHIEDSTLYTGSVNSAERYFLEGMTSAFVKIYPATLEVKQILAKGLEILTQVPVFNTVVNLGLSEQLNKFLSYGLKIVKG